MRIISAHMTFDIDIQYKCNMCSLESGDRTNSDTSDNVRRDLQN